tara:strand:- start:113 stop:634 length:522 start_codon:yes stop_codon:yes gene_type:complete
MNTLSGNGLTIGQSLRPNYQMQIAGRDTKQPGGIPNRPYEAPKEDPNNPYVPAPNHKLAGAQDINTKMHILNSGMMVDENGKKYNWDSQDQKFIDRGDYDPYYDGLPIPMGQHNSEMKIAKGFVKNVGEPMGVMSATQGMKIIDDTETNPLKKELRRIRMFKNNPIDPGLGGV